MTDLNDVAELEVPKGLADLGSVAVSKGDTSSD